MGNVVRLPLPSCLCSLLDRLIVDIVYICASISIRFECFRCCESGLSLKGRERVPYAHHGVFVCICVCIGIHVQVKAGESHKHRALFRMWWMFVCLFNSLPDKKTVYLVSLFSVANFICFYLFIILWGCRFVWASALCFMLHLRTKLYNPTVFGV